MGYIKHNAIVVTSWKEGAIASAAMEAERLGMRVIGPSEPAINGYRSILICPDGSKESWTDSDQGDRIRAEFVKWTQTMRHDDGSSPLEWFEAAYGSDDKNATIVRSEWGTLQDDAGE